MMEEVLPPIDTENMADAAQEKKFRVFVGPQAERYMQKWRLTDTKRHSIGWNWAGALFGMYWLAYRKMYLFSAAYMVGFLATGYLLYNKDLLPLLALLFNVLVGLFGDTLYRGHAHRKLFASTQRGLPAEYQENWLKRKGGTRWLNILFPTLVAFLFSFTLSSVNRFAPPPENEASRVAAQNENYIGETPSAQSAKETNEYLNTNSASIESLIDTFKEYGLQEERPDNTVLTWLRSSDQSFSLALMGSDTAHVSTAMIYFSTESDTALTYARTALLALFANEKDWSDESFTVQAANWIVQGINSAQAGDMSTQETTIDGKTLTLLFTDIYSVTLAISPQHE